MLRFTYLLLILSMTTMRSAECISAARALPVKEMGSFGPRLPANTEFVPFNGMGPSFSLALDKFDVLFLSSDECKADAIQRGAHAWAHDGSNDRCILATLLHPVCRGYQANQGGAGFILEEYLSDGNSSDNAVLDPVKISDLLKGYSQVSFRVDNPTILHFEEFTDPIGFPWTKSQQDNKVVIFPNDGSVMAMDDRIPVDPACHTNSSCGVPFMTTSVVMNSFPHVILHEICDHVKHIDPGQGITLFSHAGIGCVLYPDRYPEKACFVVFRGHGTLKFDVTFVNSRQTSCDSFELKALVSHSEGPRTWLNLCEGNATTEFFSSGGRVRFFFYSNVRKAPTYQTYGFAINIVNLGDPNDMIFGDF